MKPLVKKKREDLGLSRPQVMDKMRSIGYSSKVHHLNQKLLNLEERKAVPKDEVFLRCLSHALGLSIDDVARDLGFVPEKIKKAYLEGKIQYDEGN